jgi:uncharacterized protein (DUF1330 family)
MPAYIIFTREKTRDKSELEIYQEKVLAAKPNPAMTLRVVYGRYEVLEGAEIEGVVVLEFTSFDEAKAWYDSPAYREARVHRYKGSDYRAVIVEGVGASTR